MNLDKFVARTMKWKEYFKCKNNLERAFSIKLKGTQLVLNFSQNFFILFVHLRAPHLSFFSDTNIHSLNTN
jgi:hypothetical protein